MSTKQRTLEEEDRDKLLKEEACAKYKNIIMWILVSGAVFLGAIIVIVLFWWALTHKNTDSII